MHRTPPIVQSKPGVCIYIYREIHIVYIYTQFHDEFSGMDMTQGSPLELLDHNVESSLSVCSPPNLQMHLSLFIRTFPYILDFENTEIRPQADTALSISNLVIINGLKLRAKTKKEKVPKG